MISEIDVLLGKELKLKAFAIYSTPKYLRGLLLMDSTLIFSINSLILQRVYDMSVVILQERFVLPICLIRLGSDLLGSRDEFLSVSLQSRLMFTLPAN